MKICLAFHTFSLPGDFDPSLSDELLTTVTHMFCSELSPLIYCIYTEVWIILETQFTSKCKHFLSLFHGVVAATWEATWDK